MRALLLAVLVMAASAVAADAGPRRGKVVRVERRRIAGADAIHACVGDASLEYVLCFGRLPPRLGEQVPMIGTASRRGNSFYGLMKVERVDRAEEDTCDSGLVHAVYFTWLVRPPLSDFMLGFRGIRIAVSARLEESHLPQSLGPGEETVIGVDTEGDGIVRLLATRRDCNTERHNAVCMRYWLKKEGTWSLAGEDQFPRCMAH